MARLGIIAAPGTARNIASKIKDELADNLKERLSENDDWEIDIIVDPLTGETEFSKKIYARTEEYLQENEWDYLISITDLPLFYNDKPVVIDIDTSDGIAMMSIPAFGWRPLKKRDRKSVV